MLAFLADNCAAVLVPSWRRTNLMDMNMNVMDLAETYTMEDMMSLSNMFSNEEEACWERRNSVRRSSICLLSRCSKR